MGRPAKSPEERHTETVRVSLRPADLAQLQANAAKAETTITDFVRAAALGHRFKVVESTAPDFDTIHQLQRIGVNLNQIAKRMNQGQVVPESTIDRAIAKLETLLTEWIVDDKPSNHRPQL